MKHTHRQEENFRSDYTLDRIINDVEIRGERKTVAYYNAKSEMKRKNKYKLSIVKIYDSLKSL